MNLSLPCYCVSERARHTDTVIECHVYCRHRFQICSTAGRLALCRSCRQHDHDRPHRHSRRRPPHQRRVLPQQRSGIRRHAGSAALDSFSSPQRRGGGRRRREDVQGGGGDAGLGGEGGVVGGERRLLVEGGGWLQRLRPTRAPLVERVLRGARIRISTPLPPQEKA